MRRVLPVILALALGACDAGHRENPGVDNTWPGPELVVVQPGPNQTVTLPAAKTTDGPTRYGMPRGFFDLRNLATEGEREGDVIKFRVDGGAWREVTDWSKPVVLGDGTLDAGTHLLLACVWNDKTNAPYTNPEAVVIRRFHVVGETGQWDLWTPDGDMPRAPLKSSGPAMLLTGPTGRVKGTPNLTFAFKGTGFGTRYRVAYSIDGGDWQSTTAVGAVPLKDLKPGAHAVVARLEEAHGDDWKPVPRPFFARRAEPDDPQPGEFNVDKVAFEIAP